MIRDYLTLALNNLLHRKTRSWLTLIGIFIGITAVVALISLGFGLEHAVTDQFLKLGADKLEIYASGAQMSSATTQNSINDKDLKTVQGTRGVLYAVGFYQQSAKVTWSSDQVGFYQVDGFSDDPVQRKVVMDFMTLEVDDGRDIKRGDVNKAVIGYDLTNKDKLDRPMKVGDKIFINGTQFEVVGSLKKLGDPTADSSIFVSESGFTGTLGKKGDYAAIVVQAQPGTDINAVAENVKQELRRERNLKEGDENFEVQTPQDLVDSFNQIFSIVLFVVIGIAAISLVIGGIGIMNTMYTAVLERTKEIGVMKAIGATNGTIMLIFLIESALLGAIGGAIGVLFGLGLAYATQFVGQTVLQTTLLHAWFSWWLVVGSIGFAMITGIGAGLTPARQASRHKPVDSLRYE